MECADIWVCDAGDGASFVAEALDPAAGRVHDFGRKQFDRDGSIEARVARAVHLAHPARAERGDDLVLSKSGSCGNQHRQNLPSLRLN